MTKIDVIKPSFKVYKPNYYEATITEVKSIANKFYDPLKPTEATKTQLQIQFTFKDADGTDGRITTFISPVLSEKSKFTKLLKCIFSTFDAKNDASIPELEELLGHKLRIAVKTKPNTAGGERSIVDDFDTLL